MELVSALSGDRPVYLAIDPFIWRSTSLSGDRPVYLAIEPFIWRSTRLSGDRAVYLAIDPFIWRSTRLSYRNHSTYFPAQREGCLNSSDKRYF
jgi:hypothetical protein